MGCCASVKQALTSLPGVTNIETDAGTTTALVSVDPEKFDAAAAIAALEKAHYPATKAEDVSPKAASEETADALIEGEATGEPAETPESDSEATDSETPEESPASEAPASEAPAKAETEVIE